MQEKWHLVRDSNPSCRRESSIVRGIWWYFRQSEFTDWGGVEAYDNPWSRLDWTEKA